MARINSTLHGDQYTFFITSRLFLPWMKNVSRTSRTQDQNTHFVFSNVSFFFLSFFRKSCRLWDTVEKYCRAGQATDGNMAHAHCMSMRIAWACALHDGYLRLQIHIFRLCNTYYFYTATMVARTRLIVTLYVYYLSYC